MIVMNPNPNKETPEQELRQRAGSDELIEFMQASGFKLTSSEHNTYGFWFNEKDQMTVGLVQAEYMFKLFATHYKAREAEKREGLKATLQSMQKAGSTHSPFHYVFDINELMDFIASKESS